MQFTRITLRRVAIPFVEPFRIAGGEVAIKESIIVEATTANGVVGYGEASPMGGAFYSVETPDSTWEYLEHELVPAVLAAGDRSAEAFADLIGQFSSEPFARAGIEGAVWDAHARETGRQFYALFGGAPRTVPSGLAIGLADTIAELLDRIALHLAEGYVRVKIKIEPGWDITPLEAIRDRFGDIPLMVDANASYRLADHAAVLQRLDQFALMMIEQPLAKDAFDDAAELQSMLRTPLCADESAHSLDAVQRLVALDAARIVNIKIQRVGGLSNARRIAEFAMHASMPCWLGTMPELGIATLQGVHLATHPAFTLPSDVHPSHRWFVEDITDPPVVMSAPGAIVPIPLVLNHAVIERRTTLARTFAR